MESVTGGDGRPSPLTGTPIRVTVRLEKEGVNIARARDLATAFLGRVRDELGMPVSARVVGDTQLVVSELVTNARKYAPGPVSLELRVAAGLLEVVVRDGDPQLPVARPADADRIGQHGLEIVKAIARDLEATREPTGKRITARIALVDDCVVDDPLVGGP
ncbi:ATP-binding protein [Streptomyces sp. NBC_00670]|jgi:anti-sigma regulatory factor (Ser/Thr protein kinase)|uniref:ATP-binding protein n=1 Tax=Streptomyces sp. NBC_00670 TaxID=2975804 RepID=UPI002E3637EE|nr:ATP-binding protein [Streptomyces sp. NBC_00670]